MFEIEKQQIETYKKSKTFNVLLFTIIKLVIAYFLISYLEYGIFIVLAYLLYLLENISSYQFINSQETNLQINILHEKINELKKGKKYD